MLISVTSQLPIPTIKVIEDVEMIIEESVSIGSDYKEFTSFLMWTKRLYKKRN